MYNQNRIHWMKHFDFILIDSCCLLLSVFIAYSFRVRPEVNESIYSQPYYVLLFIFLILNLLLTSAFHNFKNVLKRGPSAEFRYTVQNAAIVFASVTLVLFSRKESAIFSRIAFYCSFMGYIASSFSARLWYKKWVKKHVIPLRGRSMLLITDRIHADELCKQVQKGNFSSFRLAAFLILNSPDPDEHKESAGQTLPLSAPVLSMSAQETIEYIKKNWVDEIVLVVSPTLETGSITKAALTMGITVHIGITTLTESITSAPTTIDSIGDLDVVSVFEHGISEWNVILKRIMDIAGGLIGCIITVILTIIIGPMIFFSSPGPIFFSQNRVGKNGKIFRMYKFRSMVQNADKIKEQFAAQNRVSDGMMFKLDWDPRIIGNQILPDGTRKTGIGEFIRKTSLDEFPQFFNVLRGDMSLVGTRPPTLDEWAKYQQHHRARMSIKPGITGLWQVSGRSEITDFEEVVRLDTQYIENWSLANDVRILMRTVLTVLRKEGSM